MRFPFLAFAFAALLFAPASSALADDGRAVVRQSADRLGLQTESPGAPGAAADRRELARRSLDRLGLQTELPEHTEPAPATHWYNVHLSRDFIRFMLWGAVITGVVVIVWSLRDSLPVISRSRRITAPELASSSPTPASRMDEAQLEADDLARQGHYREAMHVLLLKSIQELRRQLGLRFAVSLTSREILRRVQLPELGRQALSAIIRAVEQTYFGGRAAGQSDYADCRGHFETLKQALAGVAAA